MNFCLKTFLLRCKRSLLNWRGDGIHSPFVFHLIQEVLRNQYPYYCFTTLGNGLSRHKQRLYELLFRLIHDFGEIDSLQLQSTEASNLPNYLRATGRVQETSPFNPEQISQLLILEHWDSELLKIITAQIERMKARYNRSAILISTPSVEDRKSFRRWIAKLEPVVHIDIIEVQYLLLDETLTQGTYKTYYKFTSKI